MSEHEYPPIGHPDRLRIGLDGKPDNVLLEWQLALTLNGMSGRYGLTCQEVLPLCVGMPYGQRAKNEANDPPTDIEAKDFRERQDQWMQKNHGKTPASFHVLSTTSAEERQHAWGKTIQLYRTTGLRALLGPGGDAAAKAGSQIEGFHPLLDQLVVPDGSKAPVAIEPDPLWRDTDRAFFAKKPASQHNKIFSEMFGGSDELDQTLASNASRLTPAAVLQHLFEVQAIYHAHELADRQRVVEATEESGARQSLIDYVWLDRVADLHLACWVVGDCQ